MTSSQSWNAYAYVRNNPLVLVDPSGMSDCPANAAMHDPQCQLGPWVQSDPTLAYLGGFADPFQLQGIPVTQTVYQDATWRSPWLTALSGQETSVNIMYQIPAGWTNITIGTFGQTLDWDSFALGVLNDTARRAPAMEKSVAVFAGASVAAGVALAPAAGALAEIGRAHV